MRKTVPKSTYCSSSVKIVDVVARQESLQVRWRSRFDRSVCMAPTNLSQKKVGGKRVCIDAFNLVEVFPGISSCARCHPTVLLCSPRFQSGNHANQAIRQSGQSGNRAIMLPNNQTAKQTTSQTAEQPNNQTIKQSNKQTTAGS